MDKDGRGLGGKRARGSGMEENRVESVKDGMRRQRKVLRLEKGKERVGGWRGSGTGVGTGRDKIG